MLRALSWFEDARDQHDKMSHITMLWTSHVHISASTLAPPLGLRREWRAAEFSHRFRGSPAIVGLMTEYCIERA